MDVRTADGSVVKISAGNEQDLAKTLGVEMVQNMYKVRGVTHACTRPIKACIPTNVLVLFSLAGQRRGYQPAVGVSRGLRQVAERNCRWDNISRQHRAYTNSYHDTERHADRAAGPTEQVRHQIERRRSDTRSERLARVSWQPLLRDMRQDLPISLSIDRTP